MTNHEPTMPLQTEEQAKYRVRMLEAMQHYQLKAQALQLFRAEKKQGKQLPDDMRDRRESSRKRAFAP